MAKDYKRIGEGDTGLNTGGMGAVSPVPFASVEFKRKIEDEIWNVWTTHPSEETLTSLLKKGTNYMSQNQLTSAHNVFSKAIELDPNWAEAWNKRATALYLLGEFQKSQNDIDKVLELEDRHFGALSGQGLVNICLLYTSDAADE